MSATVDRVPLAVALEIAEDLVGQLASSCERIEVAGSIRRRRLAIGDLDVIAVPRMVPEIGGLFDEPTGKLIDRLDLAMHALAAIGAMEKRLDASGRPCWGPDLKRATFRGLDVQVQAVRDPSTWGMWLVVRTGPAGFSHALVTPRSQKAAIRRRDGSILEYRQGMLPPGFEIKDGFKLYRFGGQVETPDERSVFAALGLPYIEPKDRQ